MSKGYFGKGKTEEWSWEDFKTTEDFPISKDLMDWIIGQEKAMEECKLCLDEWIQKLKTLKKKKWWKFWEKAESDKPQAKEWLPAGPFLLLLGKQGTGKSLLGRALATHLSDLYKKYGVKLYDVICWRNKTIPSEPRISIAPSPQGRKEVIKLKRKEGRKGLLKRVLLKLASGILASLGSFVLFVGFYWWLVPWIFNWMTQWGYPVQVMYANFFEYSVSKIGGVLPFLMAGSSMLMGSVFILFFGRFMGGMMSGKQGIGGAESTNAPKLLIDNSDGRAKFVDATGHTSAQLYGSIAWDPYQTGGLGTPEHQRVTVGDVHRAFMGILYIDEIKNLRGEEAVTLLTVLEDGQLAITLRDRWHGGGTSAMAVSTEPVPCMTFFVAAGNMDSVPQIHPALMDRIYGYGKVVHMNEEMDNSVENRRKYVQFIAQEIKRFSLLPFSREACIEVIEEARRKSMRKDKLTCIFRPMISVIKTASILALNAGERVVETKYVREAIDEHCKTVQRQFMEKEVEKQHIYKLVNPESESKIGQIHGGAVMQDFGSGDQIGTILPIRASIIQVKEGYFHVTGVKTEGASWIQNSIQKVSHVAKQIYGLKEKGMGVHIDFAQTVNVDGPSAGIAMILLLASCLKKKELRQDTVVTGEINISVGDEMVVTPVGGIHAKIIAAQDWGFKRILIPKRNYEYNIKPEEYKIEIIPCETLKDYERGIFCEKKP